jgi:hypothetical protein
MQLTASTAAATGLGPVLASQTIDIRTTSLPPGGVSMWSTEREYRLAGAKDGIDTFASVSDALRAASQLSAGSMPGLAVVTWRGGYRLHDVHAASRTYFHNSPHGPLPPITRETARSSVPFAAGNLRASGVGGSSSPAVVRSKDLVALVDGPRVFMPNASNTWAGRPRLVESQLS